MTDIVATAAVAATAPVAVAGNDVVGITSSRNDKRERKQNAQTLPPGITHHMMKKYVVYYREIMNLKTGKQQQREYFKVESHPKLDKPWISSKSVKISLIEKLNDANQVVTDLENTSVTGDDADAPAAPADVITLFSNRWSKRIPKYTMLRVNLVKGNMTNVSLIFDRKDNINGARLTSTHTVTCPTSTISEEDETKETALISLGLQRLRDKLRKKYGADLL
jgi:hypothetical protein